MNKPRFDDAPTSTSSSSRGKRKTEDTGGLVKTHGKGASGKLRDMMNLPIELFAEVCSYLGPFDLRQLALASRRIWDTLMNKQARRIWKMALSSVADLPQCPTDLNEPQYVCLMYSSECYTPDCHSRGTQVDWFYRVRFCRGCFDVKMVNASRLNKIFKDVRYRSWFPDVTRYLDRSKVLSCMNDYGRAWSGFYNNGKHFYIDAINTIVEKYKAIDGQNAGERVAEYTKELAEQSEERALTGAGMLKWHLNEMDLQAEQVTARKNARFESVKVKLVEAGWDLIDLPPLNSREFRDLVYKDQQLTPKIWQNIKPKLEPLLQKQQDYRLEQERRHRRDMREQAVSSLYHQTAHDTLSLPPGLLYIGYFIPDQRSITAFPQVQEMLEPDTETINKERWLEVEDEVRTLIRRHWVTILWRVLFVVETGMAPLAGIPIGPNKEENDQKVVDNIVAIRARLAIVTASFVCKSDYCKEIHWFPGVFAHALCPNPAENLSDLVRACEPLGAERKKLVTRMVDELGLDQESATEADVNGLKNLICARCDPNIAKYATFGQIAKHYIQAQRWYFAVKQAEQIPSHRHTVIDDHDWLSNESPLIRQHDEAERASLEFSQMVFRTQATTDPRYDSQGIGGEDFRLNIATREIMRCCKLCPHDMGPMPCSTLVMNIHIRAKHDKEPDLETETYRSRYFAKRPCPT